LVFIIVILRENFFDCLIILIFAFIAVFIERIIDKQFDLITLFFVVLSVCLTILYLWLKERFLTEAKTIKKKSTKNEEKNKIIVPRRVNMDFFPVLLS
jgi:energy-coupling factor transporter transmembrane protein EcfT